MQQRHTRRRMRTSPELHERLERECGCKGRGGYSLRWGVRRGAALDLLRKLRERGAAYSLRLAERRKMGNRMSD